MWHYQVHHVRLAIFIEKSVAAFGCYMKYLALDIGRKHTGIAFADAEVAIALPLDTIHHENEQELRDAVRELVEKRQVETLVIGLPLLMSGQESEETKHVRTVSLELREACPNCSIEFLDERETSKAYTAHKSEDRHAQAATTLLSVFLDRRT